MPITLNEVTFVYNPGTPMEVIALNNINLNFNEGIITGIIGPTGSGKSTLLMLLNGLLTPTRGNVVVDGLITSKKGNLKAIRQKVQLIFQYPEHQLFAETVFDELTFGPKNFGREITEEQAAELLRQVGLDESYLKRSPFELSGGEKRRLAIASVLGISPKYLILDEPAAALDPAGKETIYRLLLSLKKQGVTVIIVSHNMDEVAYLCDQIVVLDRGRIAAFGEKIEVFHKLMEKNIPGLSLPVYAQVIKLLQSRGHKVKMTISLEETVGEIVRVVRGND
ncbi:cobalt ABC transporter ATP-binding protein [Carboxydothermus islandicus]|uniref:Cobalt ABC transporter ATP-binding protein n=1 Tax=Carboxydothermus islandicus TaxID=661089 RepID=A0A1L8D0K6_9THEO|nr:ATP-binding cassette domain-containing protein [Carboxydothermus islandicus]GAV24674.1 cobalt ABC transporter ATP-binding protein [Carboxydothermus islandicus]